jgi:hypothetical protein
MSVALKIAALLALGGGLLMEGGGLVPAPGFALAAGVLLAIYLWFLARTRRPTGPPL